MNKKKIIFSSGGTGGHIFPTISAIKYFLGKKYDISLVTDSRGKKFLKKNSNYISYILNTDTPFNKNLFNKVFSLTKILSSIVKSYFILKKEKPDLVFGVGGYVSFPLSIAAKILKIPLVIYENNFVLGRSNKFLLPFCEKIFSGTDDLINFPKKYKHKIYFVGNILREEILNYKKEIKYFSEKKISILILGGSQGAKIFGEIIPESIKKLKEDGYEITLFQQCVSHQKEYLSNFYKNLQINFNVFDFIDDITNFLNKTDLAISRAGASTSAELVHTQTPFIAVPYPSAIDDHQFFNAKYYEKKGCCWLLEQKDLNAEVLFNLIKFIFKDKKNLEIKSNKMKELDNMFTLSKIEKNVEEIILNED